jgi:hypothetical protein
MTNDPSRTASSAPLSEDAAFVIHVTAMATAQPDAVHGRIEHIVSGEATRFTSAAELLSFMHRLLSA